MPYELTKEAAERARAAFQQVLADALPAYELGQLRLFHDEDENFIRREVARKLFNPRLPNGSDQERKWIKRLKEMAQPEYWAARQATAEWASDGDAATKSIQWLCMRAQQAARQWNEVLPRDQYGPDGKPNPGRYYFRHPVTMKGDRTSYLRFTELEKIARECREWQVKWFARLMLDGPPEGVSDFKMEVVCATERYDGEVFRVVRLRNILGEQTAYLRLPASDFKGPEHFREWCLAKGHFNWGGNQTHVHQLHEDTARTIAWKIVQDVDACGWHPLAKSKPGESLSQGIWFFDECAYYQGRCILPEEGITWLMVPSPENPDRMVERGFFLNAKGRENSEFMQGRPQMKPHLKVQECDLKTAEWLNQPRSWTDPEILRAYFREICQRFSENLGGLEGYLAMGGMLSYAAAPEFFEARKEFPGLFVHGQGGSGKGTFVSWLMSLWGFYVSSGTGNKATPVGIIQQAQNYSNLPVWVDEFRERLMEEIVPVLRDAMYRQMSPKWVPPDGVHRRIRTNYVVSGETTSTDSATRGRFSHVQVSQTRRKNAQAKGAKEHFAWFKHHTQFMFLLVRFVMERREDFAKSALLHLNYWMRMPELKAIGEREKVAHGMHWASWMALAELLESHSDDEVSAFTNWLTNYTRESSADVARETNVSTFWREAITATKQGAIPLTCYRVVTSRQPHPPGMPDQSTGWNRELLYVDHINLYAYLQAWMVKQRGQVPLKLNDMRDQMSAEPGWVPGKHKFRFGKRGERLTSPCWVIELDKHPMGYQEVATSEIDSWLLTMSKKEGEIPDAGDPRKGELYVIVDMVKKDEAEAIAAERGERINQIAHGS